MHILYLTYSAVEAGTTEFAPVPEDARTISLEVKCRDRCAGIFVCLPALAKTGAREE